MEAAKGGRSNLNKTVIPDPCHSRPVSFPLKRESMHGVNSSGNPKRKELHTYPFGYYLFFHHVHRYTWHKVRILRETGKAILVDNGMKTWIPKSQIMGIRLRDNAFEIYIREGLSG